jgi:hypothetical protein
MMMQKVNLPENHKEFIKDFLTMKYTFCLNEVHLLSKILSAPNALVGGSSNIFCCNLLINQL